MNNLLAKRVGKGARGFATLRVVYIIRGAAGDLTKDLGPYVLNGPVGININPLYYIKQLKNTLENRTCIWYNWTIQ